VVSVRHLFRYLNLQKEKKQQRIEVILYEFVKNVKRSNMSKNITSLRNHLFDALNRLADATEQDIDLEVNKSIHIVNIAEAVIKTAEVENQFLLITKGIGSGFIPLITNDNNGAKGLLISDEKEEEYKQKMFDADKEKNWLITDGKSTSDTGIEKHEFGNNQND
jgi:hypothetical protein